MNDQERDELLIRIDQRTLDMKEKVDKFESVVTVVEGHITDIKWIKTIGASVIGLGSTITGVVAWFKHH
jgi:hypothetical protein